MSKNCIVAQSGGPTAAINASLAGVVAAARDFGIYDKIYGAMYLGSCRFKLPDMKDDVSMYEEIFSIFEEMNIGAFFYIGGNDSMDTVAKLSAYAASIGNDIRIIGVPKTIDNDLIREIAYDTYIYDLESVNIIEIMGRDAGWLTAASVLARNEFSLAPHLIYLPEVAFDKEQFITDLKEMVKKYKNVIVAVSEGIRDKDGNYISATNAAADKFGHAQSSPASMRLFSPRTEKAHRW